MRKRGAHLQSRGDWLCASRRVLAHMQGRQGLKAAKAGVARVRGHRFRLAAGQEGGCMLKSARRRSCKHRVAAEGTQGAAEHGQGCGARRGCGAEAK